MKKNKYNGNIVILIGIYFICFIFISTAYSFFSEKLDLVGITGFSSDVIKEYNYDYILQGKWQHENYHYYQYTINITYTGTEMIDAWQMNVRVPMTTIIDGCFGAAECTLSDTILRITNAHWNGNVSNESIATTSFIIKTTVSDYELDIISINFYKNGTIVNPSNPDTGEEDTGNSGDNEESGDQNDPENPGSSIEPENPDDDSNLISDIYADLSVKNYWDNTTQYDLKITNNSNIDLVSWELKYKVPEGTKVAGCWGANYVITENILTLTGLSWSQNIAAGTVNESVGFQLTTVATAPVTIELDSFTGVNSNHEDVVIK